MATVIYAVVILRKHISATASERATKIEGLDLELRQVNETQDDSASLERWPLLGQGPNSILAFPDGVHVAACARFCELP